jgi:tetratricopeptide (TPR) repeat protein
VRAQVIAEASAIIASAPQNIPALLLRADAYANDRQFELAVADCTAVLAIEPTNLGALLMRANIARYYSDQPATALADLDAAVAAHPDSQTALLERLFVRAIQGDQAGVLADAEQLVALSPDDLDYLNGRGFAYLNLGQNEAALADFERALLLGGQDTLAARYGRGKLLLIQGQVDEALADLEAAALRADELPVIWDYFFNEHNLAALDLAQAYNALGRGAEAGPYYDRAVDENSSWYMPFLERARYRAANGDPTGAREDLRAALTLTDDPSERGAIEAELTTLP